MTRTNKPAQQRVSAGLVCLWFSTIGNYCGGLLPVDPVEPDDPVDPDDEELPLPLFILPLPRFELRPPLCIEPEPVPEFIEDEPEPEPEDIVPPLFLFEPDFRLMRDPDELDDPVVGSVCPVCEDEPFVPLPVPLPVPVPLPDVVCAWALKLANANNIAPTNTTFFIILVEFEIN